MLIVDCIALLYVTSNFFYNFYNDFRYSYDKKSKELKKEVCLVKEEIARNSIVGFLDTITYKEHKRYLSIEDSVKLYLDKLDGINNYEIGKTEDVNAIKTACGNYHQQTIRLSLSKQRLMLAIVNNQEIDSLMLGIPPSFTSKKIPLLAYKIEDFHKERLVNHERFMACCEKHNEGEQDSRGFEKCLKEEYSLHHSREFNELELCFLDYVSEYLQMVKQALKQEQQ